jgi:hypothetical protein
VTPQLRGEGLTNTRHVKASLTAAIVARSLLAAERSSWLVGVLEGEVVVRIVLRWPVSWDVVVAVDMKSGVSMNVDCGIGRQAGT